jgi:hypothetical protein
MLKHKPTSLVTLSSTVLLKNSSNWGWTSSLTAYERSMVVSGSNCRCGGGGAPGVNSGSSFCARSDNPGSIMADTEIKCVLRIQ